MCLGIRRPCCEEHLKNLNFQEGDEAQLVCVITNALKERVKWFKDGNIVITDNERYSLNLPFCMFYGILYVYFIFFL